MNPDDLARILDELGQRLGPTGEYVFALAVRQVAIDATIALAWSIPTLVALFAATAWGIRLTARRYAAAKAVASDDRYSRVDPMDYVFPWLFAGIGIVLVVCTAGLTFTYSLSRLLNPEYAALRDILGAIQ